MPDRFTLGDRVVTIHPLESGSDFIDRRNRRSGAIGIIIEAYPGHGLCYKVLHDGEEAFYNHSELRSVEEWSEGPQAKPRAKTVWDRLRTGVE